MARAKPTKSAPVTAGVLCGKAAEDRRRHPNRADEEEIHKMHSQAEMGSAGSARGMRLEPQRQLRSTLPASDGLDGIWKG